MRRLGLGLALMLLSACILVSAWVVPVSAMSLTDHEHSLLDSVNGARAERGLQPLRVDNRLWDLAGDRAGVMAAKNVMSHTIAGSLKSSLASRGIQWYGYGEAIAWSSATPTTSAEKALFALWKGSPPHWAILMSARYNYIGVGLAYRSSNHRTFGAIVVTESKDRSGANAQMLDSDVAGLSLRWAWRGWDPTLQTHTAGLRSFTVQQRTDNGAWTTVVKSTTSTARTVLNKARGHWYGVRVRATDRAGNTGAWTAESRIWVP